MASHGYGTQLHKYGGNMGFYGQIDNVTIKPIEALANSSSLVGFGLTPEGQEGNEIIYTLLLDQAWSDTPIDTALYFRNWVGNRYSSLNSSMDAIPEPLYAAWDLLRTSAYNNTNLTSNAVPKSIFELAPNTTSLVNRTGHHPTTLDYGTSSVIAAWESMILSANQQEQLWIHPAFQHDLVDVTRQVFANAFLNTYMSFVKTWNVTSSSSSSSSQPTKSTHTLHTQAPHLETNLQTLNDLLCTLPQFSLAPWITSARSWARGNSSQEADFYGYNARNQITLWGPNGEINDYASKQWGGLVGEYYMARWEKFLGYVLENGPENYNAEVAREKVRGVEERFQEVGSEMGMCEVSGRGVREVIEEVVVPVLGQIGVV